MAAAYNGHAVVVSLLLKSGANQSIVDVKGKTALGLAEMRGQTEAIRALREHGAQLPPLTQ
jgi:ankyrin repeat protein